jgi:pimeloyl-ACP methyl ester carboxylesterase
MLTDSVRSSPVEEDIMKSNLRTYGNPPFRLALLHGGPGTAGGMAPLAREIASFCGVLEPLQTADSIDGQVEELKSVLERNAELPVTLVGHSWGAWLGFIFSARNPGLVKKLIMVSSGGFREEYAAMTHETRLSRLRKEDREEVIRLLENLRNRPPENGDGQFARLGELFFRADAFDPLPQEPPEVEFSLDIYRKVWGEATALRKSGRLLEMGRDIACPVTAIHGDHDPHPAKGVEGPLYSVLRNFRFILLKDCGHKPWIERRAKERFLAILEEEVNVRAMEKKQSCRKCGIEYGVDEKHPGGCCRSAATVDTESRCAKCPNARAIYDLTHGQGRQRVCKRTGRDVSPYIREGETPDDCPLARE